MTSWANLSEQFALLPRLLSGHLILSLSALLVGVAVSVPLGIRAARSRRWAGPILAVAGIVQTIPGLALLALMVPLLGGMIGFWPAFAALTVYSILPTLRNTVTGLEEVDSSLVEAALAVGMTDRQRLWKVELPLALPTIIAGVRTASVWVVGTTALSTPVGFPSLGNYIFAGLQTRNWVAVLFGCFFSALLAILFDRLIHHAETGVRTRRRGPVAGALAGLLVLLAVGVLPILVSYRGAESTAGLLGDAAGRPQLEEVGEASLEGAHVSIGSKAFTEQYILAELLAGRLEAAGARVETVQNLGSTILFDALRNNTIDAAVDYTGTIWTTLMDRSDFPERSALFIETAGFLLREHGILTVGRLGFENAYCFAMTREESRRRGIRTIEDLAERGGGLTIGGDPEFFGRPDWVRVREIYGLDGLLPRSMDSTFMYGAVREAQVDVIAAYSTDGRIDAFDLEILDDPLNGFPPYDAILLLSPRAREISGLEAALLPLVNAISAPMMRAANGAVDLDGENPSAAAAGLAARIRLSLRNPER